MVLLNKSEVKRMKLLWGQSGGKRGRYDDQECLVLKQIHRSYKLDKTQIATIKASSGRKKGKLVRSKKYGDRRAFPSVDIVTKDFSEDAWKLALYRDEIWKVIENGGSEEELKEEMENPRAFNRTRKMFDSEKEQVLQIYRKLRDKEGKGLKVNKIPVRRFQRNPLSSTTRENMKQFQNN